MGKKTGKESKIGDFKEENKVTVGSSWIRSYSQMRKENRPFTHSRGTKPICWKAKAYILDDGSVGPGSPGGGKGKKRGSIGKMSASEASRAVAWGGGVGTGGSSTDYLSAHFARLFLFSPTPFFFSFSPRCEAWSQAN